MVHRHQALLVCDEVQAGFGRCGTMWGFEHYGIVPDLATFGKGISSSLPLAAVVGRPDVMDLPDPARMTSTHTGNPVCCAAALASVDLIVNEDLAGNSRRVGELLHQRLALNPATVPASHRPLSEVRAWWPAWRASSRGRKHRTATWP